MSGELFALGHAIANLLLTAAVLYAAALTAVALLATGAALLAYRAHR